MADPIAFITVQDLVDALGEETYMALFDDHNTRSRVEVDESTQVVLVMKRAHATAASYLPNLYATLPATNDTPATMSELLRHATLEFAQCYAYRRRPEYMKTYGAFPGGDMWKGAVELMQRIQRGEQRIEPVVAPADPPANHAGFVADDGPKATIPSTTDNTTLGDW
jgi:hypothetical protein